MRRRNRVKLYNQKVDRHETVPLHLAVIAELELIKEDDHIGRVFPWSNRSSLCRWLPQLCKRVGVEMTPHMARYMLGSIMAANGEILKAIMAAPHRADAIRTATLKMVRAATAWVKLAT